MPRPLPVACILYVHNHLEPSSAAKECKAELSMDWNAVREHQSGASWRLAEGIEGHKDLKSKSLNLSRPLQYS